MSGTALRSQQFARALIFAILLVTSIPLYAQTSLWETLIAQGNAALVDGNISAARKYYEQALELTQQTIPTDLAPYATQRNIAQTYVRSANLEYADSLYTLIIPKVSTVLVTNHPYRLNLLAEQAEIREAIRLAAIMPEPVVIGLSFWELMEKWWLHFTTHSRLRAGPTKPMGGQYSTSHTDAMSFDIFFKSPWLDLGRVPIDLGIRRSFVRFGGKHTSTGPITITGLAPK